MFCEDSLGDLKGGVEAGWPWGDGPCLSRSPFSPSSPTPSLADSNCYKRNRSWSTTSSSTVREEQCGAAYFSTRPPATPLRLTSLTPAAAGFSTLPEVDQGKFRQEMKSLIYDKIASLPLRAPDDSTLMPPSQPVQIDLSRGLGELEVPESKKSCQSTLSMESSASCIKNCRNIAVQANRMEEDIGTVKSDDVSESAERRFVSTEWVGGVRALRDAHTRLVLRQLRHITRLNRALDRAAASHHHP